MRIDPLFNFIDTLSNWGYMNLCHMRINPLFNFVDTLSELRIWQSMSHAQTCCSISLILCLLLLDTSLSTTHMFQYTCIPLAGSTFYLFPILVCFPFYKFHDQYHFTTTLRWLIQHTTRYHLTAPCLSFFCVVTNLNLCTLLKNCTCCFKFLYFALNFPWRMFWILNVSLLFHAYNI